MTDSDKEKEFRDALDSHDPDRIGDMLSEMSDADFARIGQEYWDSGGGDDRTRNIGMEETFRSFRARTGCLLGLSSLPLRLALACAAAAVVAVLGFWAGTASSMRQSQDDVKIIAWNEIRTDYGETVSMTLPDSSRLWVNSGSRILYPEEFIGNERKIYLSGEIYIEVDCTADFHQCRHIWNRKIIQRKTG